MTNISLLYALVLLSSLTGAFLIVSWCNANATTANATTANATTANATTANATTAPTLNSNDITDIIVEKNKFKTIDLTANATGSLAKVPLTFSIVQKPKHGDVIPVKINDYGSGSVSVTYTPTYNYTGRDSFTFAVTAVKASPNRSIGNVSLEVVRATPSITDPRERAAIAFILALIIDSLIFLTAYAIIKGRRQSKTINIRLKFWDIIRDENWYPSLPRFQLILWTGIIIFVFFGIALYRLFSGVDIPASLPSNIFIVLGLTAGTAVTSSAVSRYKYAGTTPTDVAPTKEVPSDRIRKKLPKFKTMLMENDKISLARFQTFAWTWVGIVTYLGLVFLQVNYQLYDSGNLSVPDLPMLLIVLMGIGQGTFLGNKSVKSSFISINEIRPRKISLQREKNFITVLGSNFGTAGSVWLEYYSPVTQDEMQHCSSFDDIDQVDDWIKRYRYQRDRVEYCYDITPKTTPANPNLTRQDARIVTSLDDIIYNLKSKEMGAIVKNGLLTYETSSAEYVVRVEKDGLLTYANSDATLTITNLPPTQSTDHPPKAEDLSYSTEVNKLVEIQLKATDPDADDQSKLTYIKVSDPTNGTLSDVDSSTGKVTYTPKANFVGEGSFTYKANDGKVDSNTATVKISVRQATDHPPKEDNAAA
jgi:Bacterial Ig domain